MRYCVPKRTTGVYALIHIPSGQMYIGSSKFCVYGRFRHHFVMLRKGTHATPKLQALWNKSKPDDFKQKMLEFCEPEHCREAEKKWSRKFWSKRLNGSPDAARKRWRNAAYRKKQIAALRITAAIRCKEGSLGRKSWSEENVKKWRRSMGYD